MEQEGHPNAAPSALPALAGRGEGKCNAHEFTNMWR